MVCPSLSSDPEWYGEGTSDRPIRWKGHWNAPEDVNYIDNETAEFVMRIDSIGWKHINNALVPGLHLGIIKISGVGDEEPYSDGTDTQILHPFGVHPVYVNVEL